MPPSHATAATLSYNLTTNSQLSGQLIKTTTTTTSTTTTTTTATVITTSFTINGTLGTTNHSWINFSNGLVIDGEDLDDLDDLPGHYTDRLLSWQGICLIIVFCTLIVITIIGNTLVILAVITTRRLKTVTNCFVMSLAVADLLVGIFVMPPAVAVHLTGSWQLGWVLCDVWISLDVLLCTASILSLCAISVDRYLAVTQPLTYSRRRRSKRLALVMILIVWLLALAITCPPILGWYEPGRRDLKECRYNQNEGYVIFSAMGSFFIPMSVMVYVYARISCVIASRHDHMSDLSVHNKKFKRHTSSDIDNDVEHEVYEFELSTSNSKRQKATSDNGKTPLATNLNEKHDNGNANRQSSSSNPHPRYLSKNTTSRAAISNTANTSSITLPATTTISKTSSTYYERKQKPTKSAAAGNADDSQWTCISNCRSGSCPLSKTSTRKSLRGQSLRPKQHPSDFDTNTSTDYIPSKSHQTHLPSEHPTRSLTNRFTSLKKENKTTQTLSIVVGGFIACWLPFFIYYLLTPFLKQEQVSQNLAKILTWLGWFNSGINPFIYAFYSIDFRVAFWRLTCKRFFGNFLTKGQFSTNTTSIRR